MKKYLILLIIIFCSNGLFADIKLASLFTDNLVLQRDKGISVWGKADAGEKIIVTIQDQNAGAIAGTDGNWMIKLSPMNAGGPFEMTVEGKNKIVLKNIMIGEVWLCSGQSNMEFTLAKSENSQEEIEQADFPSIRLFIVKHHVADTPQEFCEGEWVECSPKTAAQFSAAGYFFGKKLFNELNVPIGLIQSTWGGTAAECWTPKEILESDTDFIPILKRWNETLRRYPAAMEEYEKSRVELMKQWKSDSANAVSKGKAPPRKPPAPSGPGSRNTPAALYNGMIAPIIPYAIQGAIWYQGESNVSRAYQYRKLFPAMITSWRTKWGFGDFPFYYVQLPNLSREPEPSKSGWAELREAQLMTLSLPNTGMAVTIDVGDSTDLHPANKKDVGLRLALIAESKVYGKGNECSGPIYNSMKVDEDRIRISFNNTGKNLLIKNSGSLRGFTICGGDRIFVNATAVIEGNEVVVRSESVKNPVAVRYAWADNPKCNLYNSAMLPASPFRTDDWPELTFYKK